MKYVISVKKDIIIFPDWVNHRTAAGILDEAVRSAGTVSLHEGQLIVGGDSFTLGVKSDIEDEEIIKHRLNLY